MAADAQATRMRYSRVDDAALAATVELLQSSACNVAFVHPDSDEAASWLKAARKASKSRERVAAADITKQRRDSIVKRLNPITADRGFKPGQVRDLLKGSATSAVEAHGLHGPEPVKKQEVRDTLQKARRVRGTAADVFPIWFATLLDTAGSTVTGEPPRSAPPRSPPHLAPPAALTAADTSPRPALTAALTAALAAALTAAPTAALAALPGCGLTAV